MRYNGVVCERAREIELLGGPDDLDPRKWAATLHHEILHVTLFRLGVREVGPSEELVSRLLGREMGGILERRPVLREFLYEFYMGDYPIV
jgi:hypothetical protein